MDFLGMFSQLQVKPEAIIAEGDMVATRETWKVTMAATNKTLTGETVHFFRVKDGLITEEWSKGWEWLGVVRLKNRCVPPNTAEREHFKLLHLFY